MGRGRSGRGSRSRAGGCVRTTWIAGEAQIRVLSSPLSSRLEQVFLQLEPEQTATQASDFRESTSWRKSNKMGRKSCRRGARPTRGCEDAGRFSEGRPPEPSRFSPAGDPLLPRLFHGLALKNTGCTVAGRCPSATAVASRCLPSTSTSFLPLGSLCWTPLFLPFCECLTVSGPSPQTFFPPLSATSRCTHCV